MSCRQVLDLNEILHKDVKWRAAGLALCMRNRSLGVGYARISRGAVNVRAADPPAPSPPTRSWSSSPRVRDSRISGATGITR